MFQSLTQAQIQSIAAKTHTVGLYKNSLLFSNTARNIIKNSQGFQLNATDRLKGILKDKHQIGVKQSTSRYISTYNDQLGRLRQFKQQLIERFNVTHDDIDTYTQQQIALFFPWLMSANTLFQPFRLMIVTKYQNIEGDYAKLVDLYNGQQLNLLSNKAIYESIRFGSPVLEQSINMIQDISIFKTLWTAFKSAMSWMFLDNTSAIKPLSSDAEITTGNVKTLKQLARKITSGLRSYGSLVVKWDYIKANASTKKFNGVLYYYFSQTPTLLFSINQSIVKAYVNVNGNLKLIEQKDFNSNLLKSYIKVYAADLKARMLQTINMQAFGDADQQQQFKQFADANLKWKNNGRQIDPAWLTQNFEVNNSIMSLKPGIKPKPKWVPYG